MGSDERPRKKAKVIVAPAEDEGLGGLYDFLPPPDPEKDEAAKAAAVKHHLSRPALPQPDRSRVIFLDVDGVILPAGSIDMIVVDGVTLPAKSHVKESDFSAQAMGSLRAIVQQTGATIVLSSEWRRGEDLKSSINAVLKSQDIPSLRDATPIFQPRPELQKVLDNCDRICCFLRPARGLWVFTTEQCWKLGCCRVVNLKRKRYV
ncbi:unnamed protein product [Durusdinium trenchii]|uniref:Uncharacterized protein n=1 Tax=Durusdinium trenchii TaxID=1381693 RepID=A0ABP0J5F7_9DINO